MKILIIGAGELGALLAEQLSRRGDDVTMIDSREEEFDVLRDKLEIRAVEGNATDPEVMRDAGADTADLVLAVSGDEAVNIIACRIASALGKAQTVCRLYSKGLLSGVGEITPRLFGICYAFSPPEECARKVMDVLKYPECIETIRFSNPNACMTLMNITRNSLLAGTRLKDLAGSEAVEHVRISAIVRDSQFLIPHGETIIASGDNICVSGTFDHVDRFIAWATDREQGGKAHPLIILSGVSPLGIRLAELLQKEDCTVRVIEPDREKAEKILDLMPQGTIVIQGNPTDEDTLTEAGVSSCDVFVSTSLNDDSGILSCLLAKQYGAGKVVAVTYKSEYTRIVPSLPEIDCSFNSTLVSLNSVLRLMNTGALRIYSKLQRFQAHISEMTVTVRSPLVGKALKDLTLPSSCLISLLFRGEDVISPSGNTVLEVGDVAVVIMTPETEKELASFFPSGPVPK